MGTVTHSTCTGPNITAQLTIPCRKYNTLQTLGGILMTADQLEALGPQFTAFLQPFEPCFDTPASVQHCRHYTRGLLSDLPRKTAEPLALAVGTPPRSLQQFLKACLWDHEGLTAALQRTVLATVAEL